MNNQKIIFKDKSEVLINQLLTNNTFANGRQINGFSINLSPNTKSFEDIKTIFQDQENLSEFDLFDLNETEWIYQGTHIGYSLIRNINYSILDDTYTIEIELEDEVKKILKQHEDGLLELANLVSELLV